MSDDTHLKLQIRSNRPTAAASKSYNSKVDALAFNLSFIAEYQPKLAVELLQLYAKAHVITEDSPKAPEEDYDLFTEAVMKIARGFTND